MSASRGSNGVQGIPAGSRKMVMSLKEIVNCSEAEIYAALKDCNMDPNEAVNRLLSQDPFHEVKSKRDKKKENKDTSESRSRGASSTSNRGGRSGTDRYTGRSSSSQFSSSDSAAYYGKPAQRKENGPNNYTVSSSSVSGMAGNSSNRRPTAPGYPATMEIKVSDSITSVPQPSSAYQPAWLGVPGQVSMADIVKMGRPQSKTSSTPNSSHYSVNQHHSQGPPANVPHNNLLFTENNTSKDPETYPEQDSSANDEWPLIEPSTVSMHSVLNPPTESELHSDTSNVPFEKLDQHLRPEEIRAAEDSVENHGLNHVGPSSASSRKIQENDSGGASLFDNDLYGSYQPNSHAFEQREVAVEDVASVSTVAGNFEQLSIQKEDHSLPREEDAPSVVIPDHLQVQTADCSHLSFGSFGSGINVTFSGPLATAPASSNLEATPRDADPSSIGHSDTRNSEYYGDESLRNASDGNLFHRSSGSNGGYDSSSATQPESLRPENVEMARGNHYAFPSSTPGYTFENAQQLNVSFSQSQTSSQMQNLSSFPNAGGYSSSLPGTLLAANVNPGRETDLPYSPFPVTQSMSTKYGNSVSSISGSTISMPEALKTVGFSSAQPTAQTLSGGNLATGPSVPQHLAVHPYSQTALPLGPFANMIGYPFLPQSYTYMPSAFQQASTYHQSLAAVLPQYKNSVSVSSLPQSAAVASGYGAFGNTNSVPGNFQMNPAAAPSGTTLNYDDVLSAQYKDNSHLLSLQQQSENSGMWLQGPGSRTMPAVPANTYYSFQGQSQQQSGYRQGQQPSQNYGAHGYPNFYHSQSGLSLDHQQQNARDGSLGGPQGQPKQSQQIWQNSY